MSELYFKGENPAVDMIVFGMGPNEKDIFVALVQRGAEPYKGFFALPGGFVESKTPGKQNLPHVPAETTDQAARRECLEETGFDPGNKIKKVGYYPNPTRDPRSRGKNIVTSTAYSLVLPPAKEGLPKIKGGDDAAAASGFPLRTFSLEKFPWR